jgi:hypothetical protein
MDTADGPADFGPAKSLRNFVRALIKPQVLRQCRHCGERWLVPRYLSHDHPPGMSQRRARGFPGSSMTEVSRGLAIADTDAADRKSIDVYRHCPGCGELNYAQRRMWFSS